MAVRSVVMGFFFLPQTGHIDPYPHIKIYKFVSDLTHFTFFFTRDINTFYQIYKELLS